MTAWPLTVATGAANNHASIRLVTKAGAVDSGSLPHQLTGHFASQSLRRYLLWLSVND